jgi:hypothetical protein
MSSNSAPDNVRFYKVYKALWIPIYNFLYRLVNPEKVSLKDRFFKNKKVTVNWRMLKPGQAEIEEKWLGNRLRAKLKKLDTWIKGGRHEFKGVPIAPIKIDQVKEKFGGLRIYTSGSDKEVYGKLTFAEYLSFKTCMWTGERGELYDNNGWVVTASKEKAAELGLKKA